MGVIVTIAATLIDSLAAAVRSVLLEFDRSHEVADAGYGAAKTTIDDWAASCPELGVTT